MSTDKHPFQIFTFFLFTAFFLMACSSVEPESDQTSKTTSELKIIGAMKDVMWKGELGSKIDLDTIAIRKGLYGIGPLEYLRGELMIYNGTSYVSEAAEDSTMQVSERFDVSAPFFVYANADQWNEVDLVGEVSNMIELEHFVDSLSTDQKEPFAFRLEGRVKSAKIHLQNLPKGSRVSSPKEAHQGQMDYQIENRGVRIVGFFSRDHQGVFTHHDSYMHMHLITEDGEMMGHLDEVEPDVLKLYLAK
jgi:acetolactate decarboxylase